MSFHKIEAELKSFMDFTRIERENFICDREYLDAILADLALRIPLHVDYLLWIYPKII